jgi:hypothetical protein
MILTSCGHRVRFANNAVSLTTKIVSSSGTRKIRYGTYCSDCAAHLSKKGDVLHTEEEEQQWLFPEELECAY